MPEFVATVATKGFTSLLAKLAADHVARALAPVNEERIKTDLRPHLESTYRRCIQIKTLLNPYEPVDFLSIYATQRFRYQAKPFDQYDLVEWIRQEGNNVILTGTGGSGKSMFMRYLWLSLFEHSGGRIPVFIELRAMNAVTQLEFIPFLYYTLSAGQSAISMKDFERSLENGDFVVVLDGFDELASDRRDAVQTAIMALANHYPNTKIVVSGRPDEDRFSSWTSFHVVRVAPLQKQDAVELVLKAPFDQQSKDKFEKRVKEVAFYERHKSFLSTPLLTSMMLLTFSYNYDIPDKMHLFYEQAFDALYQRHDNHKPGGHKREFHTALSEDTFKRLLSYFCLITYYAQEFEFDRSSLLEAIRKAISVESLDIDPADFLKDLVDCVCVIVPDGLIYSFAHRSFQEYFAAYCLAKVTSKNLVNIVSNFSERPHDQAITLLAAMNPERFREEYVLPVAAKFERDLQLKVRTRSPDAFLESLKQQFRIAVSDIQNNDISFMLAGSSELSRFVTVISKMVRQSQPASRKTLAAKRKKDVDAARKMVAILGNAPVSEINIRGEDGEFRFRHRTNDDVWTLPSEDVQRQLSSAFGESAMHDFLAEKIRAAATYVRTAQKEAGSTSHMMDELFG